MKQTCVNNASADKHPNKSEERAKGKKADKSGTKVIKTKKKDQDQDQDQNKGEKNAKETYVVL
jgi:hypothetical protein